jgi:hypothetical protein
MAEHLAADRKATFKDILTSKTRERESEKERESGSGTNEILICDTEIDFFRVHFFNNGILTSFLSFRFCRVLTF